MPEGSSTTPTTIDVRLIDRILHVIIERTISQIRKPLDLEDTAEAILELWRAQRLTPPFDKLPSRHHLLSIISTPNDLLHLDIGAQWTHEQIEASIQLLKEQSVIHEIELNQSQFADPSKLFALPFALVVHKYIVRQSEWGSISRQTFETWLSACHPEHSRYTLEAFKKRVGTRVQRDQTLHPFNITLALFLLMYGAVRRERALRIKVDPTNNITTYQDALAKELTRIGERVLTQDPLSKGTLLDHIQGSDKIGRVLDDSTTYVRRSVASDRGTQYTLYFDLNIEDVPHGRQEQRFDHVLHAIIANAQHKTSQAPERIIKLLSEHIYAINTTMQPVHTRIFFGGTPSIKYLTRLHERAEQFGTIREDVEEHNDDDDTRQ